MTALRLKRYGARPLAFEGASLISAETDVSGLGLHLELEVYEADDGSFVCRLALGPGASAECHTLLDLSYEAQFVEQFGSVDDALAFFQSFPILDHTPFFASVGDLSDDEEALGETAAALTTAMGLVTERFDLLLDKTFPSSESSSSSVSSVSGEVPCLQ